MRSFGIVVACCCLAACAQTASPPSEALAASAPSPAYSRFDSVELCRAASQSPIGSAWETNVPNAYAVVEARLRGLTLKGCKDLVDAAERRALSGSPTAPAVSLPAKRTTAPAAGPATAPVDLAATKRIKLIDMGGILRVPVLINHALLLDFVLDSGASFVAVPSDVVATLTKVDTVGDSDFRETRNHMLADGRRVPYRTFIIRSLKIGDVEVQNVIGSETAPGSPLLLGQSFLKRFKSWSIDNGRSELVLQ